MNYEKYYKDKDYWDRVWTSNIIMPEASSLIVQITAVITVHTNGHTQAQRELVRFTELKKKKPILHFTTSWKFYTLRSVLQLWSNSWNSGQE
jgi:hypothetical protein